MAKKLTKTELLEMDNKHLKRLVTEKDVEVLSLRTNIESLNLKLRQMESNLRAKSLEDAKRNKLQLLESLKEESREFNSKLKTKYKIEGDWGINPDTGEILEEE